MTSLTYNLTLPFGYIILCPDRNVGGLKSTVSSIKNLYYETKTICVVGNDASPEEIQEMNNLCPTIQGDNTITSLINVGMQSSEADWNMIVFAGSWVSPNLMKKFSMFIKDDKDILFPVIDRKTNFIDGSMNGIIIRKSTFLKVGNFQTQTMQKKTANEIELIKTFWALDAIENGCTFKAIVGMKIC